MPEDIISLIQENVIQGRMTKDDEGIAEEMVGQPGVTELVEKALVSGLRWGRTFLMPSFPYVCLTKLYLDFKVRPLTSVSTIRWHDRL